MSSELTDKDREFINRVCNGVDCAGHYLLECSVCEARILSARRETLREVKEWGEQECPHKIIADEDNDIHLYKRFECVYCWAEFLQSLEEGGK